MGSGNKCHETKFYDRHGLQVPPPQACVDKPFLWTDGKVSLRAALNKTVYSHEEKVSITVDVHNNSRKIIRKIRVSFPFLTTSLSTRFEKTIISSPGLRRTTRGRLHVQQWQV